MGKYILFSFPRYYPSGGFDDFCGVSETLEEGIKQLDGTKYKHDSYQHIVSVDTLKEVKARGKYKDKWEEWD